MPHSFLLHTCHIQRAQIHQQRLVKQNQLSFTRKWKENRPSPTASIPRSRQTYLWTYSFGHDWSTNINLFYYLLPQKQTGSRHIGLYRALISHSLHWRILIINYSFGLSIVLSLKYGPSSISTLLSTNVLVHTRYFPLYFQDYPCHIHSSSQEPL